MPNRLQVASSLVSYLGVCSCVCLYAHKFDNELFVFHRKGSCQMINKVTIIVFGLILPFVKQTCNEFYVCDKKSVGVCVCVYIYTLM